MPWPQRRTGRDVLMLLLLLLLLSFSCAQYVVSDLKYGIPTCAGNVSNQLGLVTLQNDLLAQTLTFRFSASTAPAYSCYLCQSYPTSSYCNTSISASIYPAPGLVSDLLLLLLDANGTATAVRRYNMNESGVVSISLSDLSPTQSCGNPLRLIALLLLTLDVPVAKDLVGMLHHQPAIEAVPCVPSALYAQIGLDCAVTPLVTPILYRPSACLLLDNGEQAAEVITPPLIYYPPLWWYRAFLLGGAAVPAHSLCGERYDTLLYASSLYQANCNGEDVLTPWYALATEMAALQLAAQRQGALGLEVNATLREALDLLGRHCEPRQCGAQPDCFESTLLRIRQCYSGVAELGELDLYAQCDALRAYFNATYPPDAFTAFHAWFYEAFKFLILPDKQMEVKAILLISTMFFLPLCAGIVLGVLVFKIRVKRKDQALID